MPTLPTTPPRPRPPPTRHAATATPPAGAATPPHPPPRHHPGGRSHTPGTPPTTPPQRKQPHHPARRQRHHPPLRRGPDRSTRHRLHRRPTETRHAPHVAGTPSQPRRLAPRTSFTAETSPPALGRADPAYWGAPCRGRWSRPRT